MKTYEHPSDLVNKSFWICLDTDYYHPIKVDIHEYDEDTMRFLVSYHQSCAEWISIYDICENPIFTSDKIAYLYAIQCLQQKNNIYSLYHVYYRILDLVEAYNEDLPNKEKPKFNKLTYVIYDETDI